MTATTTRRPARGWRTPLVNVATRAGAKVPGALWPLTPRGAGALARLADAASWIPRVARGSRVEVVAAGPGQPRATWIHGPGVDDDARAILYLHGGGFVFGSARTHRALAAAISREAGAPVLAVDYTLLPLAPLPTPVDESLAAYRWLQEERGVAPERIVVMGDSAGGNLAFATALRAAAEGLAAPAAVAALSPWLDLALDGPSVAANRWRDPFMPLGFLRRCARLGVGDGDPRDPLISPLHAPLAGLPPALIQVGGLEILLSDSERMAERLAAAGVTVDLQVWEGQGHVFQLWAGWLPEATAAVAELGAFARRAQSSAAAPRAASATSAAARGRG
ncbi:alpha/beta hydrolase [Patulibacter defluvii]|uniref:alpha/beta hydrolase n=1 Tax=Patulibacter defluvii TaxID=3095358 RepID=UPI002A74DFFA|nr:alpha/beta hydrolase [Patulibacter sp. DM4]